MWRGSVPIQTSLYKPFIYNNTNDKLQENNGECELGQAEKHATR